jgi:hypothetical protein
VFKDLFDWSRYQTPRLIKKLFGLCLVLVGVFVSLGFTAAISNAGDAPFEALLLFIMSIVGGVIGVILSRALAEVIMVVFRIEEHLDAMRKRWEA